MIIQLFIGVTRDRVGSDPVWIDTVWESLKEARRFFPSNIYREISVKNEKKISVPKQRVKIIESF